MPNYNPTKRSNPGDKDHSQYALALEFALTDHFMFGEDRSECVPSTRMAISVGDSTLEESRLKQKKLTASAIYVAYRLQPYHSLSHNAKSMMSKHSSIIDKHASVIERLFKNFASTFGLARKLDNVT